jgi:Rrf2 family nitric oxide-sensitive transcriptional repressor
MLIRIRFGIDVNPGLAQENVMRLTQFTDFGLRTLMRLASEPQRTFTTEDIAGEFHLSRNHLTKVVRGLRAAGYVVTQRGAGGGFRLAMTPEAIRIGAVARKLEGRQPLVECFRADGGACVLTPRCRLKGRLFAAREAFFRELDGMTLAECMYPPPTPAASSETVAAAPDA